MANNSVSNPTFKPRRGSYSTMHNSGTVLEEGELFVETPDLGPGRGAMKIKMGDGASDYDSLPYGLGDNTTTLTVDIVEDQSTTTAEALAKLTTGKTVGEYTGLFKKIDQLEKSDLDTYKNSLDRSNKTSNVTADTSTTAEAAEANVVNGKKLSEHIGSLKQAATKNTGSIRTLEKLISNDTYGVYITGDSSVTTNRDLKAKATTNIDIGNGNNTGDYSKPDIVIGLSNDIRDDSSDSAGYNTLLGYNNKSYSYYERGSYNTVIGYNNIIQNHDFREYISGSFTDYYTKNIIVGNSNQTTKGYTTHDIIIGNNNNMSNISASSYSSTTHSPFTFGSIAIGDYLEAKPADTSYCDTPIMIGSYIHLRTQWATLDSYSGTKRAGRNIAIGKCIGDTSYSEYDFGDFIALGFGIKTPSMYSGNDAYSGIYIGSKIDISRAEDNKPIRNTIIGTYVTVNKECNNNIIITSPGDDYYHEREIGKSYGDNNSISDSIILTTDDFEYQNYMTDDMIYIGTGSGEPSSAHFSSCYFMVAQNGSSKFEMDYSGNYWFSGTLQSTSDGTLKNIKEESVPDVSSIKAVQFEWNEKAEIDDNAVHTGYIAQEVEAVAPQYVSTNSEGIKSLNYIELLVAKVDSLEKKVSELEAKLAEKDN